MRLDKEQRRLLLLIVGLAAAFVLGAWWPQHVKEQKLRQRINTAQQQLQADRGSAVSVAALAKEVDGLKATLAQMPRQLSQESELATLLRELSTRMDALSLKEPSVLTPAVVRGTRYSIQPLSVQFKGSFPAAFALLKEIETMPRMTRVVKFTAYGDPSQTEKPVAVQLDLQTFFAPGQEAKR